jgi:hypothetical protein
VSAGFTPGPWEAERSVMGCRSIVAGETLIASVEDAPQVANARLIAAAPDLYAAAEVVDRLMSGEQLNKTSVLAKVRAALAKARGEQ